MNKSLPTEITINPFPVNHSVTASKKVINRLNGFYLNPFLYFLKSITQDL